MSSFYTSQEVYTIIGMVSFPNEDSLLRLMGSVLIELHEAMQVGRAIFSKDSLVALMKSAVPVKLIAIAGEQQQLRAAAAHLSVAVKAPASPRLRCS